MPLETLLAALHILAILTLVVFITSSTALCQPKWLNGAALERLAKVNIVYTISVLAVLATGLARAFWGIKGAQWYWSAPLLHLKLTLFVIVALMTIKPLFTILGWRKTFRQSGSLPTESVIAKTRRQIMAQAHVIPVIAVVGVLFANGWWHK